MRPAGIRLNRKDMIDMEHITGRLTLPTDVDMVKETIELKELLGADALRDCDGTNMPEELLKLDGKIYATRSEERRVGKECRSRWSPYH